MAMFIILLSLFCEGGVVAVQSHFCRNFSSSSLESLSSGLLFWFDDCSFLLDGTPGLPLGTPLGERLLVTSLPGTVTSHLTLFLWTGGLTGDTGHDGTAPRDSELVLVLFSM